MPALVVFDADMLKAILIKEFSHFRNRYSPDVNEYPMKKMLHFIKDDHWKHVRSTLSPTFNSGKLRRMQQQIEACADVFVNNLQQKADNDEEFDFRKYCGAYTMDVIASTGFGLRIDSHNDPNNMFVQMANKLFDFSATNLRVFLFQTNRLLQLMANAHLADADEVDATPWDTVPTYVKTDSGVWSHQGLTHEEVLAQSLLFFFAGYETTANTLSLFAYCLAVNQDCQDKLIAEIDQVMQGQVSGHTVRK